MARTCATSDHRSSASVTMRNVMPCLPALLSAERTSCQDLPRNCRSGRSTRVSSATCTRCQPSSPAASAVSSVAENRHGTQPLRSHRVRTPARPRPAPPPVRPGRRGRSRRPRAAGRRRTTRPSGVRNQVFSGQVAIHDSVPPPLFCSICVGGRTGRSRWSRCCAAPDGGTARGTPADRSTSTRKSAVHSSLSAAKRGSPSSTSMSPPKIAMRTPSTATSSAEDDVEARDDDGEPPGQALARGGDPGSGAGRGPA